MFTVPRASVTSGELLSLFSPGQAIVSGALNMNFTQFTALSEQCITSQFHT